MKRLHNTLIILIGLFFASCEKESAAPDPAIDIKTIHIKTDARQYDTTTAGWWVYNHHTPAITSDVYKNGDVRVFYKSGGDYYTALPAVSPRLDFTIDYHYKPDTLRIIWKHEDLNVPPPAGSVSYKLVILDNLSSKRAFNTYSELAEFYSLAK